MDEFRVRFGRRVRQLREARGLSQQQLADAVSINLTHLSNIENGRYGIRFSRLETLASALSCELADLFTFDPPESG
ncbi:MAG: helix-turn-helix transcriptional regulator [Gammaproteobacteria bacterium]|nr:helix-turn-helix transcriptional regulator [Gammaproteobacteria bacterium]